MGLESALEEKTIAPSTEGGVLLNFFSPTEGFNFYYPGLHRKVEGTHEVDYRRILTEMQTANPSLRIRTVCIITSSFYSYPNS